MSDSDEIFHYWPDYADAPSPCGVNVFVTPYTFGLTDWAQVTCPACLASEKRGRRETQIERAQAAADEALRQTAEWSRVLRDVNGVLAGLRALLAAETGSAVPQGGSEVSDASDFSPYAVWERARMYPGPS